MTTPLSQSPADNSRPAPANCPCGSGKDYTACCGPLLAGEISAPSATKLMRSRYTAYVVRDSAYIRRTWHSSTRPATINPDTIPDWNSLQIVHTEEDKEAGRATVEFIARAIVQGNVLSLHEKSRFVRENGQWFYVDGNVNQSTAKPGRNAPCPCGSGKKFKKCCGYH